MRVPRHNDSLNDAIEELDQKLIEARRLATTDIAAIPLAWEMLTADELTFVDGEIERCLTDPRYFMENYYVIRDEAGRMKTLFPFFDHQFLIHEAIEDEWAHKGCCRLIILKPRQAGSTTWTGARIFHPTIFVPNTYSVMMAQDADVSSEIYQRVTDAYHNLPWFLQAEYLSKQQGKQIIFQRADEGQRIVDPGLGSTLLITNAQKASGVAIGRTIKNGLFSEASRWIDSSVWTADIDPSLNAPDTLCIMESTAYGRVGLFYNLWQAAEKGESEWRPLFIPVYKVRKYSLPIYKSENFALTSEESGLRTAVKSKENFTIPLGFFKWRRMKVRETIAATGSDEAHAESYPLNPVEAFISSGACAFPRKELDRQLRENCIDPIGIGEIEFTSMTTPPILHLHAPRPDELREPPERVNRLWVWEQPEPESSEVEYYLSADVGAGEEGADFSDITVYRLGWGAEPNYQVAEWHGHMNPSHLAKVIAALGQWYHGCEVAVEYQASGITTGNELQWALDYPNIYRWKHLDKISNNITMHTHWVTTFRTREDAINRMNEQLLDHSIVIRNHHTIEEMRDFGREEGVFKAQGLSGHDDAVLAALINVGASSQSNKRQEMAEARGMGTAVSSSAAAGVMPRVPTVYSVYDHLNRHVAQVDTEAAGNALIAEMGKKYQVDLTGKWRVVPVVVMRANTIFSPVLDGHGAYHDLATTHGMAVKNITPDILQSYRDLLARRHYTGTGTVSEDDD